MKKRHELKYEISREDALCMQHRLSRIMKLDPHTENGCYHIRSLYFDDLYDKALFEKISGVSYREKYRLRYYNSDPNYIVLEKKVKENGLCMKEQTRIDAATAESLASGKTECIKVSEDKLISELYGRMTSYLLKPKVIVDYTRVPFIFSAGNVRVTFDSDVRSSSAVRDFLSPESLTRPVCRPHVILEIKYDEFLPGIIRDAVQLPSTYLTAFSKYAASRIYF